MTKVYIYKMIADSGGAPCVSKGILSLAICKPRIRSSAERDDIILGFAANSLYRDNSLVYLAKVTEQIIRSKQLADNESLIVCRRELFFTFCRMTMAGKSRRKEPLIKLLRSLSASCTTNQTSRRISSSIGGRGDQRRHPAFLHPVRMSLQWSEALLLYGATVP
jgi:hypothetical protein